MSSSKHTVGNDDAILPLYRLVRDRFREIDGEEDGVHLTSDGIEGRLEEYCPFRQLHVLEPLAMN